MDATCIRCRAVHEPRHCGGHRRDGRQCGNPRGYKTTHEGFGNCRFHGGCTGAGIAFAERERERLAIAIIASADGALSLLCRIVDDPAAPIAERRRAAETILDRAGLAARNVLLVGEAPPEPLDDRKARIAGQLEALLAGQVIDTTVADGDEEDSPDE